MILCDYGAQEDFSFHWASTYSKLIIGAGRTRMEELAISWQLLGAPPVTSLSASVVVGEWNLVLVVRIRLESGLGYDKD